jgi:hypothetical protein
MSSFPILRGGEESVAKGRRVEVVKASLPLGTRQARASKAQAVLYFMRGLSFAVKGILSDYTDRETRADVGQIMMC